MAGQKKKEKKRKKKRETKEGKERSVRGAGTSLCGQDCSFPEWSESALEGLTYRLEAP